MKLIVLSLALFSTMSNASTVCYKSMMSTVTEVIFTIKNANKDVLDVNRDNIMTAGTSKCVKFNEQIQETVDVQIFHHTGIIWIPKTETCNFENISNSVSITSHGKPNSHSCTIEEMSQ